VWPRRQQHGKFQRVIDQVVDDRAGSWEGMAPMKSTSEIVGLQFPGDVDLLR
jgi:hypothetical protein